MKKFILLFFSMAALLYGSEYQSGDNIYVDEKIRVVPQNPTSHHNKVNLKTIFPRPYENKRKNPINIQLRLKGFVLGAMTQDNRSNMIRNSREGQAIRVVIDNEPYLVFNQVVEQADDKNRKEYDKLITFHIPYSLKSGQHIIRSFPVCSYGESIKDDGGFSAEAFYYQDTKKIDKLNINLDEPFLTYNEPQGRFPIDRSNPILLDFYVTNCQLSDNGYKVRLSNNEVPIAILTKWIPYYIYGLEKGTHTVKLELIDKDSKLVNGFFNLTERQIQVE